MCYNKYYIQLIDITVYYETDTIEVHGINCIAERILPNNYILYYVT